MNARLAFVVVILLITAWACHPAPAGGNQVSVPSIIEPVPSRPTQADPDRPGEWIALPGIEPQVRAFLVAPPGDGPLPALLVTHFIHGITPESRRLARQFCRRGFLVIIPDLMDGLTITSPLAQKDALLAISPERTQAILNAGLTFLRQHPRAKGQPTGLLGVSALGSYAFQFLASGPPVDRAAFDSSVVFLLKPALKPVPTPTLLLTGSENKAFGDFSDSRLAQALGGASSGKWEVIPNGGNELLDPIAMGANDAIQTATLDRFAVWFKEKR